MKRLISMLIIFIFMGMQVGFVMSSNTTVTSGNKDMTAKLTEKGQDLINNLQMGNYKAAEESFDEVMKAQLPMDKLKVMWESIIVKFGKLIEQQGTRHDVLGGFDIIYITCKFEKQTWDMKLAFNNSSQVSGLFFVPTIAVPKGMVETNITVGSGEWALKGTLSLPEGKGPFPVVILVHGSGPNDRDETIGPNKPFRDLAWGIVSKGIAVLRYDKRTKVYGDKILATKSGMTVKEETIDDAVNAVNLMEKTKGIDKNKIYVLGHSLGGMLIPRIAKQTKTPAGFIVLAGVARPLEDVMLEQMKYLASLDKKASIAQREQIVKLTQIAVNNIKQLTPSSTKSEKELLGVPDSYWLDFRGYNPAKTAKDIKKPMLILQGERDYQVTMEDFKLWKSSLSSNKNVTFKTYKDLNHLFMTGNGKSTPEEYYLEGHVSQSVIDDICKWIIK
jgi:dienelactone hydrolase